MKFKGEERKIKNKIVECNSELDAHNLLSLDTWIILNNLFFDKHIVDIFRKGKGLVSLRVSHGYIQNKKKQIPLYLIFKCGMTHLYYSLKKLSKTFKLQKELLKTEKNHDEVVGNNYKDKKLQWLDYVKNDVLCTAFSYARYTKAMEEKTGFGMKDCLLLPGLGWKYFDSSRTEEDEPLVIYNDKDMRWFVRQSIKIGRVCAFNRYYKSKACDDILKINSEELKIKENLFEIIEAFLDYKNKHFKIIEKEYGKKYNDYRDEYREEKKLSMKKLVNFQYIN